MLCCKVRDSLLLECLITFPRYMRMTGRASDSIYKPVMVNTVSLLQKYLSNFM